MKTIKFLFVALSMIIFISCGTDSGGGGSEEQADKPKYGKLQGSLNIDLTPYIDDGFWYGNCSSWYIDVNMAGTDECTDTVDILWNQYGVKGSWSDGYTEYFEYRCYNIKPGTYTVEIISLGTHLNQCKNPDGSIVWYDFTPLYGTFEVEAGETTQILPATIVPYQAP